MGFKVISMFSGAGGLDMGFHNKGFQVLWANDFNKDACDTYDKWANYNENGTRKKESQCTKIVCGDISKVPLEKVAPGEKIDVVLGGFPCQGFSLGGPRQVDDTRNVLYRHFVEMVRQKRPKVLIAENVIGIKTLGGGAVFEKIVEDFNLLGYTISAPTVNAKDFGVPQDRMRVIFIGIREDISKGGAFRLPTKIKSEFTLGEALRDMEPVNMEDVCQASFSSRFMSRNRKRGYDEVSFTIPAMAKQVPLSPDSEGMVHVGVDQYDFAGLYNRRLSYKEAAAIQTFPPNMEFCGELESRYKQIGNAVPVRLAEVIASQVHKILTTDNLEAILNYENPDKEVQWDTRLTPQVLNGKAFEYAVLVTLYEQLIQKGWQEGQIEVPKDVSLKNIKKAYNIICLGTDEDEEEEWKLTEDAVNDNEFIRAARLGSSYFYRQEPILWNPEGLHIQILAQPDSAGMKSDVRDILLRVYLGEHVEREIGISCKNNNDAVKHPRITEDMDFAKTWAGMQCSKIFFKDMEKVQKKIDEYAQKYDKWSEAADKKETIYSPIIQAFVAEIKRLGVVRASDSKAKQDNASRFARNFYKYMFGNYDYYKIIKEDRNAATKIYPYNINGTLMAPYREMVNRDAASAIKLPKEIVEVRVKPRSMTTFEVYFEEWIISMRLHNADARIRKTSLKYDVQIKAQPRKIHPVVYRDNE